MGGSCAKGCCQDKSPAPASHGHGHGHGHGKCPHPEVSQTGGCAKGCCDVKKQAPKASQTGSCAKGCCQDKSPAPASHGHGHGHGHGKCPHPKVSQTGSCAKGCCKDKSPAPSSHGNGGFKANDSNKPPSGLSETTVTITDAGELASCDVNLCYKAIHNLPAVSHVESVGEKSFKVQFSSTEVTAVAQIKGAVEDMGFDVE